MFPHYSFPAGRSPAGTVGEIADLSYRFPVHSSDTSNACLNRKPRASRRCSRGHGCRLFRQPAEVAPLGPRKPPEASISRFVTIHWLTWHWIAPPASGASTYEVTRLVPRSHPWPLGCRPEGIV